MTAMLCPVCRQLTTRPDPVELAKAIQMSRLQRRIIDELAANFGRFVEAEKLVKAAYRFRPDGGPLSAKKIIDIEIHWLRQRLLGTALEIETGGNTAASSGRRLVWRWS